MKRIRRTFNTRVIRATLTYSTGEIAALFGVHKRTIQNWYKEGLPRIDDRKPYIVHGSALIQFLDNRQNSRKRSCRAHEFYCLKCRGPRPAWENAVDIIFPAPNIIRITGLCAHCNTTVNKVSTPKKLPELRQIFMIQQIRKKDLSGCAAPLLRTDTGGRT